MGSCASVPALAHHSRPHASGLSVLPGKTSFDPPVQNFYSFDKEPMHRGSRWVLHGVTHIASGQRFVCKTVRKAKLVTTNELQHLQNEIIVHRKLSVCRLTTSGRIQPPCSSRPVASSSGPTTPVRHGSQREAQKGQAERPSPQTSSNSPAPSSTGSTDQAMPSPESFGPAAHYDPDHDDERPSARTMQLQQELGSHPNIAVIHETFEDAMSAHVILEECTGCDLFDRIKREKRLDERTAAAALVDVLAVVSHCHAGGVVHRGIQPEAFMYTHGNPGAPLKAIDFATAAFVQDVDDEVVGSPLYVAPEMLSGSYGVEADLWSCGVLLYVMLAGYAPFEGDSPLDIFEQVVSAPLNLKTHPWPDISPSAKDLVSHLLIRDPKRRMTAKQALRHPWFQEQAEAMAVLTLRPSTGSKQACMPLVA